MSWSPTTFGAINVQAANDACDSEYYISEVGKPVLIESWFKGGVGGFNLRSSKIKPKNRSRTTYRNLYSQHGLSRPISKIETLPAAGTRLLIQPQVSAFADTMMKEFYHTRADVTYFLYVPIPLGMSLTLRVSVPEIDETTATRGVIWKTGGCNFMAVHVGWHATVPILRNNVPPKGHPGLSLYIETIADNSSADVSKPYQIYVTSYVHNFELFGALGEAVKDPPASFKFTPVKSEVPTGNTKLFYNGEPVEDQMNADSSGGTATLEVPAGSADAVMPDDPLSGIENQPIAPTDTSQEVQEGAPAQQNPVASKPQNKVPNQKWTKLTTLNMSLASDTGVVKTIKVTPLS